MSENKTVTSAGLLLAQMKSMQADFSVGTAMHIVMPSHFSLRNEIPWQIGLLNFHRLIDNALSDVEILPEGRRDKYVQTIEQQVRGFVSLDRTHHTGAQNLEEKFTELTIERIENFADALQLAGRSYTLEQVRLTAAVTALDDLLADIGSSTTDVDKFVVSKLAELRAVLDAYEMFGSDGVRDYVATIVGSIVVGIMEVNGPLPDQAKDRVRKVLSVAKGVMDGFVYLASGAQSLEWAQGKIELLIGPGTQ